MVFATALSQAERKAVFDDLVNCRKTLYDNDDTDSQGGLNENEWPEPAVWCFKQLPFYTMVRKVTTQPGLDTNDLKREFENFEICIARYRTRENGLSTILLDADKELKRKKDQETLERLREHQENNFDFEALILEQSRKCVAPEKHVRKGAGDVSHIHWGSQYWPWELSDIFELMAKLLSCRQQPIPKVIEDNDPDWPQMMRDCIPEYDKFLSRENARHPLKTLKTIFMNLKKKTYFWDEKRRMIKYARCVLKSDKIRIADVPPSKLKQYWKDLEKLVDEEFERFLKLVEDKSDFDPEEKARLLSTSWLFSIPGREGQNNKEPIKHSE